ncbi:hypothetical protein Tco_1104901 [Tanacetum coccineum]
MADSQPPEEGVKVVTMKDKEIGPRKRPVVSFPTIDDHLIPIIAIQMGYTSTNKQKVRCQGRSIEKQKHDIRHKSKRKSIDVRDLEKSRQFTRQLASMLRLNLYEDQSYDDSFYSSEKNFEALDHEDVHLGMYSLTPSRDKLERLEKANEYLKSTFNSFSEKERQHLQLEEHNSVNESLTILVQKLTKSRKRGKAKLKHRDEKISNLQEKIRLLEEQSEVFHEVQSECDSEIFHDTKDNSEKDLISSLQTQLKETVELVVYFLDEKYFATKENKSLKDEKYSALKENESLKVEITSLQTQVKETVDLVVSFSYEKYFLSKENESLKVEIQSLQTENYVLKSGESELSEKIDQMKSEVSDLMEKLHKSDQEMKQQIILFEEDKRMFLAKNEFLEKVSSSVQKEYNDLLASNDVLKQRLETKFKLLQNDNSLEKTIEIIEKEIGDKVKGFDAETKVFENKISKLEKDLYQRVKDFDDVIIELSKRTDKFETYFANLEKENALLKSQLASQNYTSLQKENNDLRTSFNVLKETYVTDCEKLEKQNSDLKMHYKRLFDSIKQKKVDSQVFTKSNPKVNVSEKIYMGESSKLISKKVSQFTTYSLQKDRKYLKKQH